MLCKIAVSFSINAVDPALGLCALLEIIGSTSTEQRIESVGPSMEHCRAPTSYKWPGRPYGAPINGEK